MRPRLLGYALLGLGVLAALFYVAVGFGSRAGALELAARWPAELLGGAAGLDRDVLLYLRLPRAVSAVIVGAALALSGMLLQGVTRNPLADPYLLGISGGAGLFVVVLKAFSSGAEPWWLVPVVAFAGASCAAFVVVLLGRGGAGRLTAVGLILAGVVVNALCAALMTFLLARADPFRLRITTLWLAGGLGVATWPQLALSGVLVAALYVTSRAEAHRLNALALGSDGASYVGVEGSRLLLRAALSASLLAAIAVSVAGLLGYVGLLVPHLVRRLVGGDLRRSLFVGALGGALLLLGADTLARLVFAPEELPTGVLTAILGCPVLLVLVRRELRGAGA